VRVVYVAEQTEPVRRRVALKVIKLGMETKLVVAWFEAERQALAMMDHPNIAKVLDAGSTGDGGSADFSPQESSSANTRSELPDRLPASTPLRDKSRAPFAAGRPYFVMELVRGIRITDYCDQNNLSTKERLVIRETPHPIPAPVVILSALLKNLHRTRRCWEMALPCIGSVRAVFGRHRPPLQSK
jgi:serine/threonine protein kinase